MLAKILRNEWRLLFREKTLWVAALLLMLFAGYAIFNGTVWVDQRNETVAKYLEEAEAALAEQRAEVAKIQASAVTESEAPNAGQPNRAFYEATLPPGPLAALTIGQSDIYPYRSSISTWRRQDNLFRNYQIDSPFGLLAGKFDFTFVAIYLLPLLIIALSYNFLSGEKENGTLAMALSQPLSAGKLVFGKVLARLILLTGLMIALGVFGWLFSGIDTGAPGLMSRFILWLAVVGVYVWFWFALSALVSAFGRSSEANATILMSAWLLLVLVIPALLNLFIQEISPVPSRMEYISAIRAAENDAQRKSSELLAQFYHEHPELVAEEKRSDFVATYYTVQREVESDLIPVTRDYEQRLARQQGLVNTFRFLSPAVMVQETLNDLAGSSLLRQQNYVEQLRSYLTEWKDFLAPKIFRKQRLTISDYDALPRFRFQEETLSAIVARALPAAGGLLILTVAILAWTAAKLHRYRVVK